MFSVEKRLNRIENALSIAAALPIVGTVAGGAKVLLGGAQFTIAGFVYCLSSLKNGKGAPHRSLVHIRHGLGNIAAGFFEATPVLGTLAYCIRKKMEKRAIEEYLRSHVIDPKQYLFIPSKEEMCGEGCIDYVAKTLPLFQALKMEPSERVRICRELAKRYIAKEALSKNKGFVQGDKLMTYPELLEKGGEKVFSVYWVKDHKENAAKMTRTSTELPRLEPESSASTNSAMAANNLLLSG